MFSYLLLNYMKIFLGLIFFCFAIESNYYLDKKAILNEVNELRAKGCKCGGEFQKPVAPVIWNETLFQSAINHAKEMSKYNFFSHFSRSGKNIGQRLTAIGYPWKVVGENIGEGQRHFSQVMEDWIKSETHCKMLMDKRVNEMAVARYKKYWVQHFGKQLPKRNTNRKSN